MKRPIKGHTPRQFAYAVKKLKGDGKSKKAMALEVGYPPSVAAKATEKIESTEGFANAMIELASKSNNIVLAAMHEYQVRGFKNFSNKDLNGALNAISTAWEKFNKVRAPDKKNDPDFNPLKRVIMQKVENQTINVGTPPEKEATAEKVASIDMDF